MLSDCRAVAMLPVQDMDTARNFYENTLGLKISREDDGGLLFECGSGTHVLVYQSFGASDAAFTQVGWSCQNFDGEMADLRGRGITFEQYDLPGLKTDADGVATMEGERVAWFKDPAGNLLSISTLSS